MSRLSYCVLFVVLATVFGGLVLKNTAELRTARKELAAQHLAIHRLVETDTAAVTIDALRVEQQDVLSAYIEANNKLHQQSRATQKVLQDQIDSLVRHVTRVGR